MATNGSAIYWANQGNGTINELPLGGDTPSILALRQATTDLGVTVDSHHIYWANFGNGTINEAPLTGGAVTTLATRQARPWGVAVDSNNVYWANQGNGTINEAPLTGGAVTTLATGQNQLRRGGGRPVTSSGRVAVGSPSSRRHRDDARPRHRDKPGPAITRYRRGGIAGLAPGSPRAPIRSACRCASQRKLSNGANVRGYGTSHSETTRIDIGNTSSGQ